MLGAFLHGAQIEVRKVVWPTSVRKRYKQPGIVILVVVMVSIIIMVYWICFLFWLVQTLTT